MAYMVLVLELVIQNAVEAPLKISPQQNYFTSSVIFKLFLAFGERVGLLGKTLKGGKETL